MLVDDSPDGVETLQLLLELEGAVVTTANSGQEALTHLFPGLDEDQALEQLLATNPSKCIFFTRGDRG